MTEGEKLDLVDAAIGEFGWDFFMTDQRDILVRAAPFHIENEKDKKLFVEEAAHDIPWKASLSPNPNL
jgi:hypothetical protein